MKRITRIVMLLMCMLSLWSCKNGNGQQESVPYSFAEKETCKVSEILKDYRIVPLETTEDNLIMDVTEMQIFQDKVFIMDSFSPSKSIYVFQLDGKYIGKLGKVGNGPGEYILPYHFMIDEKNNRIYVHDLSKNNLLAYDLSTFQYVENHEIPFFAGCVERLGEEKLIWYVLAGNRNQGDFAKHIQVTDLKGEPSASYIPPMDLPNRGLYNVMSYFTRLDGDTYFHHPFMGDYMKCSPNDTILQPEFTLQFEHLSFPTYEFIAQHKEDIIKELNAASYITWCNICRNSRHLLCYLGAGKDSYWGVYDLEDKAGWYIACRQIEDDLGIGRLGRPKGVHDDWFINTISLETELPPNSVLKDIIPETQRHGNPALMFYKIGKP